MEISTRTLVDIAQILDSATEEGPRLQRTLELVRGLLRSERCLLVFDATSGDRRDFLCAPSGSTTENGAARQRMIEMLERFQRQEAPSASEGEHHLALPLVAFDEVTGILLVERWPEAYSEIEVRLFAVVAAQVGGYLGMLRLHRKAVELDRFKEEMLTLIVHDLKNPLAAVMANVDYLAPDLASAPDESLAALADIQSACNRMLRLIANLLDLSRLEAQLILLRKTPVALAQMLQELTRQRRIQARGRGLEIELVGLGPSLVVPADEDLLSRVFENILDNALRHTPGGGRIEVSGRASGEWVDVRIGNTGPSIPASARSTIFEKFGQSGGAGRMNLGLGLYFGRLAIEAHGGRLWVEETPTLPTIFAFRLPS